jgi:PTH1 family peptidyl-tRNA hydrolase
MILFAGLGNPGAKYAGNRHNIGFMAVDEIARCHGFPAWRSKFGGEASEGRLGREKVLLLKPQTYMNESGRSVGEAVKFYKLDPEQVFVFHDELDLAAGKLRCKTGGGLAGHNGLRSIAAHIGPDFHRVRLGIGHPGNKGRVHSWVLKDFAKHDLDWLDPMITAIGRHGDLLASGENSQFQNKVHLAISPKIEAPKPKKAKKPEPAAAQTLKESSEKSGPLAAALKTLFSKQDGN